MSGALNDDMDAWPSIESGGLAGLRLVSPTTSPSRRTDPDVGHGQTASRSALSERSAESYSRRRRSSGVDTSYRRLTRDSLEALSDAGQSVSTTSPSGGAAAAASSQYALSRAALERPSPAGPSNIAAAAHHRKSMRPTRRKAMPHLISADSTSSEESDGQAGDDDDDDDAVDALAHAQEAEDEEEMRRELSAGGVSSSAAGRWDVKGKGKAHVTHTSGSIASTLPPELLSQILKLLDQPRDILNVMLVSKDWCLSAFPLIWHRPQINTIAQYSSFIRTILRPSDKQFLPYARTVRRINLANVAAQLQDGSLFALGLCTRCERLALPGATKITSHAIGVIIDRMPELVALDLSGCTGVDDNVLQVIAARHPRMQGLNLTGIETLTDTGLMALAGKLRLLRRLKLRKCSQLTDKSLIHLVRSCPVLLELDISQIGQITDATVFAIFMHLKHLRDFRLMWHPSLTSDGFPSLDHLIESPDAELEEAAGGVGTYLDIIKELDAAAAAADSTAPTDAVAAFTIPRPVTDMFDNLRVVDFTGCAAIGDDAIVNLVANAPRIRSLTLAKCSQLTNKAVYSICDLGKHLHYLHLGHVSAITDEAVKKLARTCTRLRYIDLACCTLLTDRAVVELASLLPKLRRIGLVKVTNVTDDSIYALVGRHSTLERMHLSYCNQISLRAVTYMLNRLLGLTHLSLTGVSAFKTKELQQFCRPCPPDFTQHQQDAFCVYSGAGIAALRNHLNSNLRAGMGLASDDEPSTRRGSSSSTSSIGMTTGAGGTGAGNTPPPVRPAANRTPQNQFTMPIPLFGAVQPDLRSLAGPSSPAGSWNSPDAASSSRFAQTAYTTGFANSFTTWLAASGQRRTSDPSGMSHIPSPSSPAYSSPVRGVLPSATVPDPLPAAFASPAPNFLRPTTAAPSSHRVERSGSRPPITSVTRASRASSTGSSGNVSGAEDAPRSLAGAGHHNSSRSMGQFARTLPQSPQEGSGNVFASRAVRADSPMQIDPVEGTPQSPGSAQAGPSSARVTGPYHPPHATTAVERIDFPVPVPSPTGARHRGYSGSHALSSSPEPYVFSTGRRASAVPLGSPSAGSNGLHHRAPFTSVAASPFPVRSSYDSYSSPLAAGAGSGEARMANAPSTSSSGRYSPAGHASGTVPLGLQYPYTNTESQVPYHAPTDYVRHVGAGARRQRSGSAGEAISHLVNTVGSTAVSAASAVAGGVAAAGAGAAGVVVGGRARGESVSSRLRWVADIVGWGAEETEEPESMDVQTGDHDGERRE